MDVSFFLGEGRGRTSGGQGVGLRLITINDIITVGGVVFTRGGVKPQRRRSLTVLHSSSLLWQGGGE